jgi:hypothetical protein
MKGRQTMQKKSYKNNALNKLFKKIREMIHGLIKQTQPEDNC